MTEPVRFEKYTKTKVADAAFFIGITEAIPKSGFDNVALRLLILSNQTWRERYR